MTLSAEHRVRIDFEFERNLDQIFENIYDHVELAGAKPSEIVQYLEVALNRILKQKIDRMAREANERLDEIWRHHSDPDRLFLKEVLRDLEREV